MLIGGGLGSTAGGIKLTRVYLLFRISKENINKRLSPYGKVSSPYYYRAQGKTDIDSNLSFDTVGFIVSYLTVFIIGSLLICLIENCNLTNAMFEFASSLGTVGLSIGITSPTAKTGTLIVEIFGMILGRLEIFVIIIALFSGFTKIKYLFIRNKSEKTVKIP
jgi:trk system potassium uptake protein TrkH